MAAYAKEYVDNVIESQGKLFDFVSEQFPDKSTEDFIEAYMKSLTRKSIDEGQAYVSTMDFKELWEYFLKTEGYELKNGPSLQGFLPAWIGQFYAYYQWYYNISSNDLVTQIPLSFLIRAYPGLHDLELDLAVRKVGGER